MLLRPAWLQQAYMKWGWESSFDNIPKNDSRSLSTIVAPGHPIGVLEIPRLGLSSVVIEGDEAAALLLGVGHLSDTPMPWHRGNSVLAAHRDTFFRPLERIRRADVIRFSIGDTELEYVVENTRIVAPTDVQVLAPTSSSTLTLITCYPFDYIGPAPKRFVVTAIRLSSA
jgi:sortase A